MVDLITIGLSIGLSLFGLYIGSLQTKRSDRKITENVIDILKHMGIIPSDSGIKVNDKNQVVKPVGNILTVKYGIKNNPKKSPI